MHPERTLGRDGVLVADGYGLKVYVERGHLIVHHGIGRDRHTHRLSRATGGLKRLIVIGHTGFVTLEAMRWLKDIGAGFVQIGRDGELIAMSAPARHHESKLRRAQVLAAESRAGREATVQLLQSKLLAQAEITERLSHLKAVVRIKEAQPTPIPDAIRGWAELLDPEMSFARMREIESSAGRVYWQTWAQLQPRFERSWARAVPDHWHRAGSRTSYVDGKRARKAATPVHALLNYIYAILEVEAAIAAHALGFDPSLGIMHVDQRYRGSLATDLMEPARPAADRMVLDLLESRELRRGDIFENREGVCRIGTPLATELAHLAPKLRAAVAPHAEQLARMLMRAPDHPTPLTRSRHTAARQRPRISVGAPG